MTGPSDIQARAQAYIACLENLRPERLDELRRHLAPNARFVDPFNDVTGIEGVVAVFERMFEDVTEIDFRARDLACAPDGQVCYLAWALRCRTRRGGMALVFEGVTELAFDQEKRIRLHHDHWDAASQFYAKFPLLGSMIRMIRKRLGSG